MQQQLHVITQMDSWCAQLRALENWTNWTRQSLLVEQNPVPSVRDRFESSVRNERGMLLGWRNNRAIRRRRLKSRVPSSPRAQRQLHAHLRKHDEKSREETKTKVKPGTVSRVRRRRSVRSVPQRGGPRVKREKVHAAETEEKSERHASIQIKEKRFS